MTEAPVQPIPTDADSEGQPEATPALCLSGGGYRAMVFHIGVLWRLYEAGLLGGINAVIVAMSPIPSLIVSFDGSSR